MAELKKGEKKLQDATLEMYRVVLPKKLQEVDEPQFMLEENLNLAKYVGGVEGGTHWKDCCVTKALARLEKVARETNGKRPKNGECWDLFHQFDVEWSSS